MGGPFSQAFLAGDARAAPFLKREFAQSGARLAQAQRASSFSMPAGVHASLVAQNKAYTSSPAREANLAALGQPGTTVMVTGQQAGLFLGPLYTFHKAAAVIADARQLEKESGIRCVPVFWLQSEDHDFDEINECVVVDREGELVTLRLADGPVGSRVSVKHLTLGPSVAKQLEALGEAVGVSAFLELLGRHYRVGAGLVQAFAGVLAEMFADEGLILVDPREAAMAEMLAPVHAKAVRDAGPISQALQARATALEAAGFEVQVRVRPGAPLSFFHPEGPAGPRVRVDSAAGLVAQSALCWSSSALLRPILQDSVFPTAGYVGGPGELNYFAQLPPLYEAFGLKMPMFVPRARFRLIDARTRSRLEKKAPASTGLASADIETQLVKALGQVLDTVPAEPGLADALKRTRGTIERAASRFASRYERFQLSKDQVEADRIKRIDAVLTPRGEPQERVLGLPSFACRSGLAAVKSAVFAALVPFDPEVKDVLL